MGARSRPSHKHNFRQLWARLCRLDQRLDQLTWYIGTMQLRTPIDQPAMNLPAIKAPTFRAPVWIAQPVIAMSEPSWIVRFRPILSAVYPDRQNCPPRPRRSPDERKWTHTGHDGAKEGACRK